MSEKSMSDDFRINVTSSVQVVKKWQCKHGLFDTENECKRCT